MSEPTDQIIRAAAGRAWGVAELPEAELMQLLEDPEALLCRHLDRPVKIDHGSLIVQAELPLAGGSVRVAYKRYRPATRCKAMLDALRRSRAKRSRDRARILLEKGVATARPLAVCEPRRKWFDGSSYLATEWLEDAENLHLWAWRLADCPMGERLARSRRCAESLGRLIGRMHAAGVANRDLKGANLLVSERDGQPTTTLIDPDGVRRRRRISAARRASDLARLAVGIEAHGWVSRGVCGRFVRAYLAQLPPGSVSFKRLWRDVARRSARLAARLRRRGEEVL